MHIYLVMVITMGCDTVPISDWRLLNLAFSSKEVHWSGSVFVIDSRKVGGPDRKILHDRFLLSLSSSSVMDGYFACTECNCGVLSLST